MTVLNAAFPIHALLIPEIGPRLACLLNADVFAATDVWEQAHPLKAHVRKVLLDAQGSASFQPANTSMGLAKVLVRIQHPHALKLV